MMPRKTLFSFIYNLVNLVILLLYCPLSFAAIWDTTNFWHPVLTLTGGRVLTSDAGESKTFSVDSSQYSYSANNAYQNSAIFGGFVGTEIKLYPDWALQLGLAYYQTSLDARGVLTQGADARSSDQFGYRYRIRSQQALIESKFLFDWCNQYHPYLTAGIGEAFNKSHRYQVNFPPFLTFSPIFANHQTNSFTYSVGLGVDIDVSRNWRVGVGYRFADLGQTELGSGHIDTVAIAQTLKQSHLYINEIVAQLTYAIK